MIIGLKRIKTDIGKHYLSGNSLSHTQNPKKTTSHQSSLIGLHSSPMQSIFGMILTMEHTFLGTQKTREEEYNLFLITLKSLTVMVSDLLMANLQKKRQMIKQHDAMNNFSFASAPLGFQLHGNVVWPL